MRKILILVISLLTLSINSYSQIDYVNNADIIIKRVKNNLFTITKIQDDSTILYTGFLESKKPIIKSGLFNFYTQSGHLVASGNYDHNVLVGEWLYFDHRLDSEGKVHYDTLNIVDYDLVHKYMSKVKHEAKIQVEPGLPTYNRGNPLIEFKKYINANLIYPAFSKYEGIEGSAIISMRIDENGKVQEPIVLNTNNPDFITEAYRLMIEAKGWDPRMLDGKPVKSVFTYTINFNIH